jgi:nucleoside 2-deoxyribosyltransferase
LPTLKAVGLAISKADEYTMDHCDLIIVNMTPWPVRPDDKQQLGLSTDVGTAFEMGYMRAQHKPVFAYTNTTQNFLERAKRFLGDDLHPRATDPKLLEDRNGFMVDNTLMHDNLMLDGGVEHSGGVIVAHETTPEQRFQDLQAFEGAVQEAAKRFQPRLDVHG